MILFRTIFQSSAWRAFSVSLVVLAVVSVPFGFLVHLHQKDNLYHLSFQIETPEFIWPIVEEYSTLARETLSDQTSLYLSDQGLYGGVTLLYFLAEDCGCTEQIEVMTKLAQSLEQNFMIREHFEESDVFFRGVLIAPSQLDPALEPLIRVLKQSTAGSWMKVAPSSVIQKDLAKLLELTQLNSSLASSDTLFPSFLSLWDSRAHLRALIPHSFLNHDNYAMIKPLTSLVHFQSSTQEYLKERTFFGKKKHATP